MLIDWFTVVAQAVNFLVLVWLLKRLFYAPILRAIDERERRIAGQLQDATARKAEAERERAAFEEKNRALDAQHDALVRQAEADANAERRRLLEEARAAADALRARLQEAVTTERRTLNQELIRRSQDEVFAIARKALADLSGTSLEARIVDVFVGRVRELTAEDRQRLVSTVGGSSPPVVRTAFELSAAQRESVEQAVGGILGSPASVRFEVAADLVGGIELVVGGHKIAWSVATYLASLEEGLRAAVDTEAGFEAPRGAHA